MKNLLLAFVLFFVSGSAFSQKNNPPLTFKNGFWGWQFKKGDEKLKPGQVADLLDANPEAARLFSSGRTNYTISSIIGSIGGFMFGYTLGTSLGNGKPNWMVGGIGAGLIVASLPLSIVSTNKVKKAITLYNEDGQTGSLRKPELQLHVGGTGLSLVYRL